MSKSVLKRAEKLLRKRKFSQAIKLLEQQIFRFRDSFEYYALLGQACLHSGDFGGAVSYLKRADQLKENDIPTLLGLASAALKRSDLDETLNYWLKVLDVSPNNRIARNGLKLLKQISSGAVPLQAVQEPSTITRVQPRLPFRFSGWSIFTACFFIAVVFSLVLVAPAIKISIPKLTLFAHKERPGILSVELPSTQPSLTVGSIASGTTQNGILYNLSEKEVRTHFERAKKYLTEYRDNLAIKEINRILLSNAAEYVKEKCRVLSAFIQDPDYMSLQDPFTFQEVMKEPPLFNSGYTLWRGKVANLKTEEHKITFDLLVGYQDQTELLGIVPIELGFSVQLENGSSVEILGKILSSSGEIRMKGISLHRISGK